MFRQIIVFTRDQNLSSCVEIMRTAIRLGVKCSFFNPFASSYQQLLNSIKVQRTLIMPRTSGVLFDDWDLTLLKHCIELGAHSTHSPEGIALLRDKDRQFIQLTSQGLHCVPTLIHRGPLDRSSLNQFSTTQQWVIKANRGNKGIGHQLLKVDELLEFWKEAIKRNDQRYIIQPFFKETDEQRLLVLGDDSYVLRKLPGDSWKKNASSSTFEEYFPNALQAKELKILNQKIKSITGLKSFAVDLFATNKKEYAYEVLEVNAHPGLSAASCALTDTDLYESFLKLYLDP